MECNFSLASELLNIANMINIGSVVPEVLSLKCWHFREGSFSEIVYIKKLTM
jgi:hypothetical protein